ncbi:hypothetical protein SSP24_50230 [Streptomyces spinoverrucosus]|uniref:Uncharacterized protein n=1 Tax=Streptomyces spinoverrucosus TaxID=284043 RepID=A0A4Y3VMH6_9ACTN|nr:hypothetical protein SSP24_50230 [Streptomyces spinoverrucosus]GHB55078.1 hypothetical protein GCM10010397_26820 [Streptomyces spinoverrucosus]
MAVVTREWRGCRGGPCRSGEESERFRRSGEESKRFRANIDVAVVTGQAGHDPGIRHYRRPAAIAVPERRCPPTPR